MCEFGLAKKELNLKRTISKGRELFGMAAIRNRPLEEKKYKSS
jgi:hypothetical protein